MLLSQGGISNDLRYFLHTHIPGDSGCICFSSSDGDVDHDGRAGHIRTIYSLELHLKEDGIKQNITGCMTANVILDHINIKEFDLYI